MLKKNKKHKLNHTKQTHTQKQQIMRMPTNANKYKTKQ